MSMLELMTLPFLECLVLVGIHSYLGIHVLKRQVIFVDLAFAQIAALGTTVAYLFHLHPTSPGAYVFSLLFTFAAAAVFALTRFRRQRIPQEAIIGLTYALAASVAILVIDRAPHGAEHIKDIMAGSILWVRESDVVVAAVVYSLVGAFHFVFRDKFLLISTDVDEAQRQGINIRLWDFLFYLSFGLVISLSVRVAGVLLVFVFLIVPAMLGVLVTARFGLQLIIGWVVGTFVSVAGLWLSDFGDFPAGPAVVAFYGGVLLVFSSMVYIVKGGWGTFRPLSNVMAGSAALVMATWGFYSLGTWMIEDEYWGRADYKTQSHPTGSAHFGHAGGPGDHQSEFESPDLVKHDDAAANVSSELSAFMKELLPLDIMEKEELLGRVTDAALLEQACRQSNDDELSFALARRLFQVDKHAGMAALLNVMIRSSVPIFRSDALDLFSGESGTDFGFDPFDEPDSGANAPALRRMQEWLEARTADAERSGKQKGKAGHRPRHGHSGSKAVGH